MNVHFILALVLLMALVTSFYTGKLTLAGSFTGGLVALFIYLGASFTGLFMLAAFFIAATTATSWKKGYKQQLGLSDLNKGRRDAWQVLANGGIAAVLGLLSFVYPQSTVFNSMMAASLATATADTLSSELGNVYGKKFYNMVTFRKDQRGLDGVISLEGTLIGITGSALIALIFAYNYGYNFFWIIVLSGTAGNLFDSLLGATLERKRFFGNNVVNVLNTLVGALITLFIMML